MYETFDKKGQHPCMGKGNQSKKDFLGSTDSGSRSYPGVTSNNTGNEQHKLLKQGSGLLGSVPSGGGKFGTEKPASGFLPGSGKKA